MECRNGRTCTYLEHVLGSKAYFQYSGPFPCGDVKNSCLPVVILSFPFVCVLCSVFSPSDNLHLY